MKSIKQISKETGVNRKHISDAINVYNLPKTFENGKNWVDPETENKLHMILYHLGKFEYLIIESKMNKN